MAIIRGAPGALAYSALNGTSVSVPYPASNGAGDKLVLFVAQKPSTANSGSVTTPAGWTLVTSISAAGGFGITLSADTGNTNLYVFERIVPAGGLSGSLSVSLTTNNVAWAYMEWLTTDSRGWQNSAGSTGSDSLGSVSFNCQFTDPGVSAGDFALVALCIPTDVTTPNQFSSQTLSQTGVTFGTFSENSEPDSSVGNDIGGWTGYAPVLSGTGSGNILFEVIATGTTGNTRGPAVFVRVRDAHLLDAQPDTFTITGQDATLTQGSSGASLAADAGQFNATGQTATLAYGRVHSATSASFTLSGASATLARSRQFAAEAGSFLSNGLDTGSFHGHLLDAQAGAFALAGQTAGLTKVNVYALDAQPNAFAFTGAAAQLARSVSFGADAAAFTFAGQTAALSRVRVYSLDAQPATFDLTGQAASLAFTQSRTLDAQAGAFAVTGVSATLTKVSVYALPAQAAAFTLIGSDAALADSRLVNAEPATFAWTVSPITAYRGRALDAQAGTLMLTGQSAVLEVLNVFILQGEAGTYTSTGQSALIRRDKSLAVAAGSYSTLGQSAQVQRSRQLRSDAGNFSITATGATLARGRLLAAEAGTLVASGSTAQMLRDLHLSTDLGSYGWHGQLAQVLFGRLVLSASGDYSIQGQPSSALVAVAFELVNPYAVHVQARPRFTRERRPTFFHQSPRSRVIHEAVQ